MHEVTPKQLLETRVRRVLARLRSHGTTEDDFVELKREWPAPDGDTAWRLGALANSAGGEDVVLLVGVDETDGSIHDLKPTEVADWWPQIEKRFSDRVAPELVQHMIVDVESVHVVALQFRTDRAPYVVDNWKGGHPIDRGVPWRVGTATRAATRSQLANLLFPTARVPQTHPIWARLRLDQKGVGSDAKIDFIVELRVALMPRADSLSALMVGAECHLTATLSWQDEPIAEVSLPAPKLQTISPTAQVAPDNSLFVSEPVIVHAAGFAKSPLSQLVMSDDVQFSALAATPECRVTLRLPVAGTSHAAEVSMDLGHHYPDETKGVEWITRERHTDLS